MKFLTFIGGSADLTKRAVQEPFSRYVEIPVLQRGAAYHEKYRPDSPFVSIERYMVLQVAPDVHIALWEGLL